MVQGSRKRDLNRDDYLLRYQVGKTQVGCSTDGGQSQGQGIQKGKASGREGKQLFSLVEASSGDVTWANRQSGRSIYTGMICTWYTAY